MIRLLLCIFRIAYMPKIGTRYSYAMNGPFCRAVLIPLETRNGFVRYQVTDKVGGTDVTVENQCSFSTWAFMCKERF